MPLDPNVQGLMARMAAAGRPKIWEVTPEEGRQGFIAIARAVDVKDVPIGRIDNGVLPAPDRALPYRLYTPVNADARLLPGPRLFSWWRFRHRQHRNARGAVPALGQWEPMPGDLRRLPACARASVSGRRG